MRQNPQRKAQSDPRLGERKESNMTVVDEHIKALEDALFLNDSTKLKKTVENTIGVFSGSIDGIIKGLDRGRVKAIPLDGTVQYDDVGDAQKLIGKLKLYKETLAPVTPIATSSGMSLNFYNSNTATSSINQAIDFRATVAQVNEIPNSVMDDTAKQELITLLAHLEASQAGGKTKVTKAAKKVCEWLFDKGVEAIPRVMPFVTQAISAAIGS